ncbi:MAG: hypothetical protein HY850_08030 [Betaproteobacteria bacterium]|nr:hypothetical protein [Betaproteobacteria bacterium]
MHIAYDESSIVKNKPSIAGDSAALRRASNRQWVLKPQDLAVALKLVSLGENRLSYVGLAKSLLAAEFRGLLATPGFLEVLPGHLPRDMASQQRLPRLIATIKHPSQLE